MFKNRHFQVKIAKDDKSQVVESDRQIIIVQAERVVDSVVTGIGAIIVVNKLTGLFCSTVEHIVVTKIK